MIPAEIQTALADIEARCEAVAAAVATGEPLALEAASSALRQAAVDFSALMEQTDPATHMQLHARLRKAALQLTSQRENLLRRSAVVARSLEVLVPSLRKSTYAAPAGRGVAFKGYTV